MMGVVCVVCVGVAEGNSGDGCDLASTLCKYDLRKGDFVCSDLCKGATSQAGKSLFRAANVWWRCAQYFAIASCAQMPRDNRCMYMAHVCFYVCCSDCVGVCGNVCCVAVVVKNSVFLSLGVLKYDVCLCSGCNGCCVL